MNKDLYAYNEFIYHDKETEFQGPPSYKCISKNRLSKNIMPGFFNGNKILFIGQNPGQPSVTDIHQNEIMSFDEHEIDYFKGFLKCKIGIYLKTVLTQLGFTVFDVGFTNVVKYSTINNMQPTIDEASAMIPILKKQIELLKPEKIVAIGAFASDKLCTNMIQHIRIAHPASHRYSFFNIAKDVKIINHGGS